MWIQRALPAAGKLTIDSGDATRADDVQRLVAAVQAQGGLHVLVKAGAPYRLGGSRP